MDLNALFELAVIVAVLESDHMESDHMKRIEQLLTKWPEHSLDDVATIIHNDKFSMRAVKKDWAIPGYELTALDRILVFKIMEEN